MKNGNRFYLLTVCLGIFTTVSSLHAVRKQGRKHRRAPLAEAIGQVTNDTDQTIHVPLVVPVFCGLGERTVATLTIPARTSEAILTCARQACERPHTAFTSRTALEAQPSRKALDKMGFFYTTARRILIVQSTPPV